MADSKHCSLASLSPEILSEIFTWFCADKPAAGPITLGLVCRDWREITLATPQLWNQLKFRPHQGSKVAQRQEKLGMDWINRSGALPCSIELDQPIISHFDPMFLRRFLPPIVYRLSSLTLRGPHYRVVKLMANIQLDMPLLHSLVIAVTHLIHSLDTIPPPDPDADPQFPSLRSVEFTRCHGVDVVPWGFTPSPWNQLTSPWNQLTSLTIRDRHAQADTVFKLFHLCENLVSADLTFTGWDSPTQPPQPFRQSFITSLHVEFASGYGSPFFRGLALPSLKSLRFFGRHPESVVQELLRCCEIESFQLEDLFLVGIGSQDEESLIRFFKMNAGIRNLCLVDSGSISEYLISQLSIRTDSAVLLPHVKDIDLRDQSIGSAQDQTILRFIQSRQAHSQLEKLTLEDNRIWNKTIRVQVSELSQGGLDVTLISS